LQQTQRLAQWIAQSFGLSELDLRDELQRRLEEGTAYLPALAGRLLGNITGFILDVFTTVFILFFLFRDGEYLKRRAAAAIPLHPRQLNRLTTGITDTLNASIYGVIVIGLGQGLLTALAFRILGLPGSILWGMVTAIFSLVPVVGTGLVWMPASIILMMTGHWWKGLILLAWGAGIVHPVDNVVRPYLISGRVKLHTLAVFFALLGGLKAFGLLGLLLGPIILSVTLALLSMVEEEWNWASIRDGTKPVPTSQNGSSLSVEEVASGSRPS
jgi:predicted PurR-regulated permease PerM